MSLSIALASYEFRNNDIDFNLKQIERALEEVCGKADLLCFGEAFLQGFDSLTWNFNTDIKIAVSQNSPVICFICDLARRYKTDLVFGYIETDGTHIYSSCAVIESGRLSHNYRRISKGWKEYWKTDDHYKEGEKTVTFYYRGTLIMLALCGDLWDYPERFKTDGVLIWPVYVNLTEEEWKQGEEQAYADQALLASNTTLMVDSFCHKSEPSGVAGTFFFKNGNVVKKAKYGLESILMIEI